MSGKHAIAVAIEPSGQPHRARSRPSPGPGAPPGPGLLVRPTASPILKDVGLFIALAAVYFLAGKLGLRLAFVHVSATTVWPPTGIALAAFLLLGVRVWPAIFAGAFFVNLTTAGSLATSIGIGAGNTLEGVVAAYLVNRFANGQRALQHSGDIVKFALLAAVVSTTVAATCGVTSLSLGGFARWQDYGDIWLTWWLGDAGGDLVVAPVVLLWATGPHWPPRRAQLFEASLLVACLVLVGELVFGGLPPDAYRNIPLEFVCIPFLLWAALRFGARGAATALVLLCVIAIRGTLQGLGPFDVPRIAMTQSSTRAVAAIRGTLQGLGPFVWGTADESLVLLQAFMGVTAVTTLILAAVVAERGRTARRLRLLSVTDALTGLANYRQLIGVLEAEIRRSQRTERPFAVLFFDVDGLKRINDRHGHLVGSRALCRLAEVLHVSCRAVDTAARFGGDEFAVVLPETDEEEARRVGERVLERLAGDFERPRIRASVGVAVYPRDGGTAEALLGAADRLLYEMKAQGRGKSS